MRLLICIDDTDSKTSEKGTGAIADDIRKMVKKQFGIEPSFVSRHQLLIHPDVPYTSHNSSMCFAVELPAEQYDDLVERARDIVSSESDPESDPGLAIADVDTVDKDLLIAYGKECKRRLMTKDDAYAVAEQAGFFLEDLGGTGDGIIGAAAGIGLRLWGYDGTMKGKPKDLDPEQTYRIGDLTKSVFIDRVRDVDGNEPPAEDTLFLPNKTKVTLYEGLLTFVVEPVEGEPGHWQPTERERAKRFGDPKIYKEGCDRFTPDVEEEQTGDGGCYDCLYRRWIESGILCQRPEDDA